MEHRVDYLRIGEANYNQVNESHRKGNHPKQIVGPDTGTGKTGNAHMLTVSVGSVLAPQNDNSKMRNTKGMTKIEDLAVMTMPRMGTTLLVRIMVHLRGLHIAT